MADKPAQKPPKKKATLAENVLSLAVAVGVALLIRSFLFEPFMIPTGSMIPTLRIDDHVFVSKFTYGLRIPFTHTRIVDIGTPERGDIVVFEYPGEGDDQGKDLIKRIVAVGGDRVRLQDNRLVLNGQPIPTEVIAEDVPCEDSSFSACRCVRQREHLGDVEYVTQHLSPKNAAGCYNGPDWPGEDPRQFGSRNRNPDWPDVVIPEGFVLALGDNRDNSSDGRYWGLLPVENSKGRGLFLWWPPGRWFRGIYAPDVWK